MTQPPRYIQDKPAFAKYIMTGFIKILQYWFHRCYVSHMYMYIVTLDKRFGQNSHNVVYMDG